jgi:hypothetical protein
MKRRGNRQWRPSPRHTAPGCLPRQPTAAPALFIFLQASSASTHPFSHYVHHPSQPRRRSAMTVSPQSKVIPDVTPEAAPAILQVIEGRYIDKEKLIAFLTKTFGEGKFAVRVSHSNLQDHHRPNAVVTAPAQSMDHGSSTRTHGGEDENMHTVSPELIAYRSR